MIRFLRSCFAAVLMSGAAASAFAGVYQCKSPSGAVIFSDQPCAKGAAGGEITVKPASGAVPPSTINQSASGSKAGPVQGQPAVSQACLTLHRRMEEAVKNPRMSEAQRDELGERYFKDCLPFDKPAPANVGERQKQEADAAKRLNDCETKRKLVAERRGRWQGLSEADRNMVVTIEKEVANGCR